MTMKITSLMKRAAVRRMLTTAILAGTFIALPAASARADRGRWDRDDEQRDDRDHGRDDRRKEHTDVKFEFGVFPRVEERDEVRIQRVYVEPVYRTVSDKVWIEPIYKTVVDRVWVPPVTKTVSERVLVPDRFEERDVVGIDFHGRRCTIKQRFLVERAHYERVQREVEITPGRFDSVERREMVCDGHFDKVERQELVSEGHWEEQRERVVVEERPRHHDDGVHVNLDFGK